MLNNEFFPTPERVIRQMLSPWLGAVDYCRERAKLSELVILEPSAGSGAIVDYIVRHIDNVERGCYGRDKSRNIYTCELDPDLKATLDGKGYKVLAHDFLTYEGDHQFDLIILNPPFSHGCEHVLHSFERVASGGHVVALVNSETVLNPFTEKRQLLQALIADHGSVEHLGAAFEDAERKTSVEVSLVRLQKPKGADRLEFDFTRHSGPTPDLSEDNLKDQVALNDVIGDMIHRQQLLREAFVGFTRARAALEFYQHGVIRRGQGVNVHKLAGDAIEFGGANLRSQYNYFSEELGQHAWSEVMDKLNIQKYMTHQVRQDFVRYSRSCGYLDFTKESVAQLVTMVFENKDTILQNAVVAVFDLFTSYYKENRCYVEGWKTNDRYKVNRKLILPRWVRWNDWDKPDQLKRYGSFFRLDFGVSSQYRDIDRVMCYLSGTSYEKCHTIEDALTTHFNRLGKIYPSETFTDTLQSEFFDIRFFKKGTLHLTFRDARLHQEFNLRACAGKLWLPEPEMKAYQERKRSPFDPAPAAAEPQPERRQLVASTTPGGPGVGGLQFTLFGDSALAQAA